MDCVKCPVTDLCKYRAHAINVSRMIKEIELSGLPFIVTMRCEHYLDELVRKDALQMEKIKQAELNKMS